MQGPLRVVAIALGVVWALGANASFVAAQEVEEAAPAEAPWLTLQELNRAEGFCGSGATLFRIRPDAMRQESYSG